MPQSVGYFQEYDASGRPGLTYGIDISTAGTQYPVNFVTAYNHGVRFIYMKCSQATTIDDAGFTAANVAAARAAGIKVGAYHFCQPSVSGVTTAAAVLEANHFMTQLQVGFGSMKFGDLFPVIDFEDISATFASPINDNAYNWIAAFANRMKTATGRNCMLYSAAYVAETYAAKPNGLVHSTLGPISNVVPLWLAAKAPDYVYNQPPSTYPNSNFDLFGGYGITTEPNQPNLWRTWQFSSDGNAAGSYYGVSSTDVDVDVCDATGITALMVPGAPVVTGIPGNTTAILNWPQLPDTNLYYFHVLKNGVEIESTLPSTTTTYTATGLTNNTPYQFNVYANTRWDNGPQSTSIYVTPQLGPYVPPVPIVVPGLPGLVRMINTLLIFDSSENLLAVLSATDLDSPFYNAIHLEQLNLENSLSFSIPAENPKAQFVVEGNLVAFLDLDGYFQLFEIKIINETHELNIYKDVFCEHQVLELLDEIVWNNYQVGQTAFTLLTQILIDARWTAGIVTVGGTATLDMEIQNKMDLVNSLITAFGTGDLQYRVSISGKVITGRYIDFLASRGSITGKRFEYGKDETSVVRQVDMTQVKTAFWGYGSSQQIVGSGAGRILFSNVVWTTPTNPLNKPAGQAYLSDPAALLLWGRCGGTRQRWGTYDAGSETDPNVILQGTYNALAAVSSPIFTYEMKIADLERISGLEHEKVRLGDTVDVIDNVFEPPLYLTARVIEIDRHFTDPENDTLVLGTFKPLVTQDGNRIRELSAVMSANQGIWSGANYTNNLIIDPSFENITATTGGTDYVFLADVATTGNKGYGSKFWWQWRGGAGSILSTYSANTLVAYPQLALYDYQAAVISATSMPYQYVLLAAAQGLNGPYCATVYVSAFAETTTNGTALLQIYACDSTLTRLNSGLPVATGNMVINDTEPNVWQRMEALSLDALPTGTLYLEFNLTGDWVNYPSCKFLADGCQLVALTSPVVFDPESSFWKSLRAQAGLTSS
jgi:phage minor structural protein